uniref:Uncharacterized protein n=1 Tax=Micrurus corallinus TaxID=54390 RepID=A0A2D4F2Y0_MICCO
MSINRIVANEEREINYLFSCYFCDKTTPLKLFFTVGEKLATIVIIFHNPRLCVYLHFQMCKSNEIWTFCEIVISFSNSRTLISSFPSSLPLSPSLSLSLSLSLH